MFGSPHTRVPPRAAPNRAEFEASINSTFWHQNAYRWIDASSPRPHLLSNFDIQNIHIHSSFIIIHLRETEFSKQFGSTANKRSAFLLLGDHFILGDKLPKT